MCILFISLVFNSSNSLCVKSIALATEEDHQTLRNMMNANFLFLCHALTCTCPLEPFPRCLHSLHTVGRQLVQRGRRSLKVPHKPEFYWQGLSHLTQRLAGVYWKIKELISNYRRIFQSLPQLRDKLPHSETNPGAVCEPASSARYGLLPSCRFI